ncbi:ImmA/IrrE family metallo-endopeptidase [Paenibacillus chibensis]|uniref:ImmA/IrrE family metallo-endopeptidase n=1 Tax=Paenibacillus chibensis TaxID=59846 RepID=A0ABU6PU51_9BACL|nr:ImmA/IrrE family metallo-endopeptidase [Paenibacillus chibensis]
MYEHYRRTELEQFVEHLYKTNGIIEPEQITITELSNRLNVWVHYVEAKSRAVESRTGMRSMFIDERLTREEQRMDFLHELCHLLRHVGNQMILPDLFTQAQEYEAFNFVFYAAIPFFMFSRMPIPDNRQKALEYIAYNFNVTLQFAAKRLAQIERRILQGQFDAVASQCCTTIETKDQEPAVGTTVYAFYDSSADVSGPSQLVIEADEKAVDSADDYLFSVDGPFDRLELEDLPYYNRCTRLFAQDLIYKDGMIGVNFAVLNLKYGRNQQYVLHMKDIERVVYLGKYF